MQINVFEKPKLTYDENLNKSDNIFRDKFGKLSKEEWLAVLLKSIDEHIISDIQMPSFAPSELQSLIHGSKSTEHAIKEAFSFYEFVNSSIPADTQQFEKRFLDFGSGWGRISRSFLRDYKLKNMFCYEPNLLYASVSRSLNPYVNVVSGDYLPDGNLVRGRFALIVGWSIFSHLSELSAKAWLKEFSEILEVGGYAVMTTWGRRFLSRLIQEDKFSQSGEQIHWYSRACIDAARDLPARIKEYENGDFVWFTLGASTLYGEAFISETVIRRWITELHLPLELTKFDDRSLAQDAFVLRRYS